MTALDPEAEHFTYFQTRPHQERVNRPFCPRLQPSIELFKDLRCLTPLLHRLHALFPYTNNVNPELLVR